MEASQEEQALVASPPSSGPSGHLLPAGEKREFAVLYKPVVISALPTVSATHRASTHTLFSPTGRRWPEGSDEGGLR